jgi:hypothetical protein
MDEHAKASVFEPLARFEILRRRLVLSESGESEKKDEEKTTHDARIKAKTLTIVD